jgi:hypothetical protein
MFQFLGKSIDNKLFQDASKAYPNCRIYAKNDLLVERLNSTRLNVMYDPDTRIILKIWFG